MTSNGTELSVGERGYLAGFIDGEGCIGRHGGNAVKGYVRLSVSQADKGVLEWIQRKCGGRIYEQPKQKLTHRQVWVLHMNRRQDVKSLLEQIRDLLIVKNWQAELALDWLDACDGSPDKTDQYRLKAWAAMEGMNGPTRECKQRREEYEHPFS